MEDEEVQQQDETNRPKHGSEVTDQRNNDSVRSRWTPKPEQILILESIFNSGMVNPPKDETVRIRKLLEKFGSVGDANVFYWFQNRRSRSRRRQRQIQATLSADKLVHQQQITTRDHGGGGAIHHHVCGGSSSSSCSAAGPCGIKENDFGNELLAFSAQMGGGHLLDSVFCNSSNMKDHLHYESGFMTVSINGVATEIPRGVIDLRGMLGPDVVLFHSSGVPVAVNEYGYVVEGLQAGESYFLVQRPA